MEEEYLDENQSIQNFVQSLNINLKQKEALEPFLDQFQNLSIVQSSLVDLTHKQKTKIMIESPLKNGKTTSLFLHLIQQVCQYENSEKNNSPMYVMTYPHKLFFQQTKNILELMKNFFEEMSVDLIVLEDPSMNVNNKQQKNTIRIIVGTILDVINCFRRENLQASQLQTLAIDDLDQLLSFGQFNNLKRFLNYWKGANTLENKQLICTLKEDCFTEIQSFKDIIEEKFVNIRIKIDLQEELQNYEKEIDQEDQQEQSQLYNQYFYINKIENLYSLLFLIAKFEVFSQNYIIISDTVEQAYANKLFIERMSLEKNVVVYNPQHPVALKSYKVSLFNNNTTKFLCAPKNFLNDMQSNNDIKLVNNFRNIVFANCRLTKKEFLNYRNLVLEKLNYKHLDKIGEYNFLFLIKEADNSIQNQQQDEDQESTQQKSFYELLGELKKDNLNSDFQPVPIDNKDVNLFNYRTEQVLSTLSKNCIKLYRLIEIKKLMLKSKKMKEYFKTNTKEKNLILHQLNKYCKQFEKTKIQITDNIPEYLKPSFVKEKEKMDKIQYMMKKNKLQQSKLSRRTLQRENPLVTEPQRLKTFSSHKLWKIKHKKIKKRPNKKLIRKGVYNTNQINLFDVFLN